jgi:hypothetical protein
MDELYAELYVDVRQEPEEKKDCQKPRASKVLILDISPKQENEYQLQE